MHENTFSLSVVLPCFNEESVIHNTLARTSQFLTDENFDYELIVVDDGSSDASADRVRQLQTNNPRIRLVQHDHNRGYGEALRTGFNAAQKPWILLMDSDGQFAIDNLKVILPLTSQFDAILGTRHNRQYNIIQTLVTNTYNWLINVLLGIQFQDYGCGFKLFRKKLWDKLPRIKSTDNKIFNVEWLYYLAQVSEGWTQVPIPHLPRTAGRPTGSSIKVIAPVIPELFRLRKRLKSDGLPVGKMKPPPWLKALAFILLVKCAFIFIAIISPFILPTEMAKRNHADAGFPDNMFTWDALHYMTIAEQGYPHEGQKASLIVFFPLFPFLIRLCNFLTGSSQISGLIVSNLFSAMGLALFFHLARMELGNREGWGALLAFMLFPTAYFFVVPYSEGVFLFFTISAWLAARNGKWAWAGILGGLSTLTRLSGLALLPALAVEYFLQRKAKKIPWMSLAWLFLIPAGYIIYLLINASIHGDPWAYQKYLSQNWHKHMAWPWDRMSSLFWAAINSPWSEQAMVERQLELEASLLLLFGCLISFLRLRLSYSIFLVTMTVATLSISFLQSIPRYVLQAFPLFMIFGQMSRKRILFGAWLVLSLSLLNFLFLRYLHYFWAY